MDTNRKQNIVEYLKSNDSKGIQYAKTKGELRVQGYSDQEIKIAFYEAPHDGKPNPKKPEDKAAKFLKENPEVGDRITANIMDSNK